MNNFKLNKIYNSNCLDILKQLDDNFIDIVITSPPYNADIKYDIYLDNKTSIEYESFLTKIFTEIYRVLKDDGRICVNIPFAIKNRSTKEISFIAPKIADICHNIGFKDFEMITWHKGKNINHFQGNNTAWGSWKSPSCPSFRPLGEAILVFYKINKSHKGNKNNISITSDEFKNWTKNIWYIDNNICYENVLCIPNKKSKIHPAVFPIELVERLLKLYSYEKDIVLDPFNGIGNTTLAANKLNRFFIGIDLSKEYCNIAKFRLKNDDAKKFE